MASAQHAYMESILSKYNLTDSDVNIVKRQREQIESKIRNEYGSKISTILYSGSYAKGTAIKLKYDLDLCVFFNHSAFPTLEGMYNSVYNFLKIYFNVTKQRVSIGVTTSATGGTVDVVPGRIFNNEGDTNLYVNYDPQTGIEDTYIQTNIKKHIKYISESGCRPIIKLMKVWKYRNDINIKSFALELLVIKALENYNSNDYANQVLHVLKYISSNIMTVRLVDPANSANIVSNLISNGEKTNIKNRATHSLNQKNWESVLW